jgi:integrase/recombinase XerD
MSQQMNENFKFKIAIDSKVKVNGSSKIYLRIRCGQVKHDYYFGVDWPIKFFDKNYTRILPRYHGDPDFDANTSKINEIIGRANKVGVKAFVENHTLSIKSLLDKMETMMDSDDNFFVYLSKRCQTIYDKKIIVYASYRRHRSSRNRLMEFLDFKALPINQIDIELIRAFDGWARKIKKYQHNTVCGFHKDINKYLNMAKAEKLIHENPYKDFNYKFEDGFREPLTQTELIKLKNTYQAELHGDKKEIMRRFLFSCVTGIRISDSKKITREFIRDSCLFLNEVKGSSLYGKKTKIPLNNFALRLISHPEESLFKKFSDKHINEQLKIIAAQCGFQKNLTFHCARDTFATLFIELGGNVVTLQKLMGHKNIRTTMIYVKIAEERKVNLMANFDTLLA